MDETTRREQERGRDQQRAEARERVRVAQEREAQQQADRRQRSRLRANARKLSAQEGMPREMPHPPARVGDGDDPVIGQPEPSEDDRRANQEGRVCPPTVRAALAEAIWTAWVDWARQHPLIAPSLLVPWAELPPDQRQAGYRMAEAAFGLLRNEADTAGRA